MARSFITTQSEMLKSLKVLSQPDVVVCDSAPTKIFRETEEGVLLLHQVLLESRNAK